jgi:hypothetical protein
LSAGRYSQVTDADELRVADGEVRFPHAQAAEHLVLGFQHDLSANTRLRIEGFQKRYEHPRVRYENQLDNLSLFPEISADRITVVPSRAQARGVELSLRTEGLHWNAWFAYAYSRAEDDIANRWVPRGWDQPHSLRAGYEWWTSRWSFAWTANWHSGWPRTRLLTPNDVVALGLRNDERPRDYLAFDARLERRFPFEHSALRAWVEVANALNENNLCCRALSVTPTQHIVAEDRIGAPLIAAFAVSWEF